jgi:dTDP-4-dehydrorhamnose reductase
MRVVVLGDGLLGSEIIKQTNWEYISRKKDNFDLTDYNNIEKNLIEIHYGVAVTSKYDVVVNCIANTDTYSSDKELIYNVNYKAVTVLSDICKKNRIKLVHISTDYVYAGSVNNATEEDLPVPSNNWYTYYKLLADEYISLTNNDHLICRCSFKPKPFPFKTAWINQIGNFDYVDVMADLIIKLINKNTTGIYNVGTNLKTMFDLAIQTNSEVLPSCKPSYVPDDITINVSKLKLKLHGHGEN